MLVLVELCRMGRPRKKNRIIITEKVYANDYRIFPATAMTTPEVEEKVKSGKYIPPSMREGANRRGESMTQSRTRGEPLCLPFCGVAKFEVCSHRRTRTAVRCFSRPASSVRPSMMLWRFVSLKHARTAKAWRKVKSVCYTSNVRKGCSAILFLPMAIVAMHNNCCLSFFSRKRVM